MEDVTFGVWGLGSFPEIYEPQLSGSPQSLGEAGLFRCKIDSHPQPNM